jgi:VIT1/CCC1 family predicted Fe2+/Mn2+ transporter
MKNSIKRGLGFGITSGIITTLGLMTGLFTGTHSKLAVLGGIITIAIADAFSDAFGIHISEESTGNTEKNVRRSTISAFTTKFLTALIFIIPIILLTLKTAIIINIAIGLILLSIFTFFVSKNNGEKPIKHVFEHLGIAITVIIITYFVGEGINLLFV